MEKYMDGADLSLVVDSWNPRIYIYIIYILYILYIYIHHAEMIFFSWGSPSHHGWKQY
jgi:hypothetical protein